VCPRPEKRTFRGLEAAADADVDPVDRRCSVVGEDCREAVARVAVPIAVRHQHARADVQREMRRRAVQVVAERQGKVVG